MAIFLNIAGSACMIVFLLLLIWRGLSELGWLPARCLYPPDAPNGRHEKTPKHARQAGQTPTHATARSEAATHNTPAALLSRREGIFWFCAALALSWLFVYLGFLLSGQAAYTDFLPHFWARFTAAGDAEHYQYLAESWYATAGEKINLIVFYPLYPLCLRCLRVLTLGNTLLAGLLLSQLCWGLAAVALRRLAGRLYPPAAARCVVLGMVLFPFSFFALGVFTESLFLLMSILTLDAIVTKRFARAGIMGFLATLCRTQGVLLLLAAVYAVLAEYRGKQIWHSWRKLLALAPIPLGYCIYLGLNWHYCGDALAFLYYQSIAPWYQHADWIGNNLAQQWGMAVSYPGLANYIYFPEIALYFVAMALLLYGVLRGVKIPLLLYGGAYIGASYLSSWLISGSRYVFGGVALYLVFGQIKSLKIQILLLCASALFLLYYACCFMQGQAIM